MPIPGKKPIKYLDDLGTVHIRPTSDELAQIDDILPSGAAAGAIRRSVDAGGQPLVLPTQPYTDRSGGIAGW